MKNILLYLAMVLFILSCGIGNGSKTEDGVLYINFGPETKTIDPAINIAVDGSIYIAHAFEGLTTKDKNNDIIPGVAESWDISEDGLTYTFYIRTNAKWSDGEILVADDFVYAWQRAVDPATASEYSYQFEPIINAMDINAGKMPVTNLGVRAIDDNTLEVKLEKPTAYFLELADFPTFYPVRKDIIEKYGEKWTQNPETYIVNGPFIMTERNIDESIVMEKNTNYWNIETIVPKKIVFVLMDNPTASVAGIKGGSLQLSDRVPPQDIPNLEKEGILKMIPRLGTYYYALNNTNEALKDYRVRRALSLVIDRNYIVNQVAKTGIVAGALVPYGVMDAEGDFRENGGEYISTKDIDYINNIEEAKELMREAGYPNGEGFPVLEFLVDANSQIPIFEAVQQMWKEHLGVDSTINQQEWAVFLQTVYSDKDYVVARSGWTGDYNDPMTFLGMFLSYSPQNHAAFSNARYDALLQTAMNTLNENVRMEAMHKAEDILMSNMVLLPIYYYTTPTLISPKLKDVVYDPLATHKFFYSYIEK